MAPRFVYFDLETSGTEREDIVQIAATGSKNGDPDFNVFSYPEGPISSYCTTNIHGIRKAYGTLYRYGEPLNDVYPWKEAVDMFFNWLQCNFPQGVILVAHNAFASDARIIIREMKRSGWNDHSIENVIHGFSDTLVAFKKYFKDFKKFKQHDLLLTFGLVSNQNHEALEDCQALWALVRSAKPKRCHPVSWYINFLNDAYKPTSIFLQSKQPAAMKPPAPVSSGWVHSPMASRPGNKRGWGSIMVRVGNVTTHFPECRLATGSTVSYIGTPDLHKLGIRSIMKMPQNFAATDHCGQAVPFRGFFDGEVTYQRNRAIIRFYILNQAEYPCLGISALCALDITV